MSAARLRHVAGALLLLFAGTGLGQEIELESGEVVGLTLPSVSSGGAQLDPRFFFDVPFGATRFDISLSPGSADNDVDIFLRAGSPFQNIASLNDLFAAADYYAAGVANTDRIIVERYQTPQPDGLRWFIAVLVREGAGGDVGIGVTVTLPVDDPDPVPADIALDFINSTGDPDCEIGPWTDATTVTPGNGNPATTLGEARIRAMQRAVEIIEGELTTPVPIKVAACWRAEGGSAQSATVAVGRPGLAFANFPGTRAGNVLFAQPVVERLAGTEFCNIIDSEDCRSADVEIRFNVDIDGPTVLGDSRFYYGLNPNGRRAQDIDFVAVAIHELVHGLGFTTLLTEDGELPVTGTGVELSDAFLANLVDQRDGMATPLVELPSDAERAAAITSDNGLEWRGPESSTSLLNDLATLDDGFVRMYAPDPYEAGSSVSHTDLVYCDLMLAINKPGCDEGFRDLNLAAPMLNEIGWSEGPNISPYVGLMFDRVRGGHGFELQFAGFDAQNRPVYVLTYYSYESLGGAPEWFQAVGFVENGVFYGDQELGVGDGLQEYAYDDRRDPPQGPVSNHRGQVVLSFNRPEAHAACNDGVDRSSAELLIAMQWTIDNQVDEWCMEPLVPTSTRPAVDFGGLWFAGVADQGWGFSIENFNGTLFVLVYVYASDGSAVWFFGQQTGFTPGEAITMPLFQRDGFSRLQRNGSFSDREAGTMTILLVEPSNALDAGNRVTIDVDYLGAEGGSWVRDDVPIQRLTLGR